MLLGGGYFVGRVQARTDDIARFLRVEYLPHPRDIVNLVEGTPFTVPSGKILVLRDFAVSDAPTINQENYQVATGLSVSVDGQVIWKNGGGVFRAWTGWNYGTGNSMSDAAFAKGTENPLVPLRVGVVAHAGQVVTIDSLVGTAYAAGFLADD